MAVLDWIMILAYFGVLGGVVWWSMRRNKIESEGICSSAAGRSAGLRSAPRTRTSGPGSTDDRTSPLLDVFPGAARRPVSPKITKSRPCRMQGLLLLYWCSDGAIPDSEQ